MFYQVQGMKVNFKIMPSFQAAKYTPYSLYVDHVSISVEYESNSVCIFMEKVKGK